MAGSSRSGWAHARPQDVRRWRRHLANERAEAAVYRDLARKHDGEERGSWPPSPPPRSVTNSIG